MLNQNPGPRADNNERRNTMAKYNLVSYNTATPNQKSPFSDLVSNLQLFNKAYDGKDKDKLLHKLPFWSDNSNYNSYPTIDDVIKNFNPKTSLDQTFVCRVRDDQIWSSDFTLGGFDRATQTNDKSCRNNLNTKKYGEDKVKGFNDDDSGTLNAYIRYQVKKDGTIVVVTFHSLEDKIVKYFFKSLSENKSVSRYMPKGEEKINLFKSLSKKPIVPSEKEIQENPPSRSAKLRYVIKKEDFYDFETDILEKFDHLIKIENFSKKL